MTEEVPPTALTDVNLRLLCHDDIDAVKQLCGDWFPIEYVAVWIWVVAPSRSLCSELQPWAGAEQAAVLKLLCTPVVMMACCHESWFSWKAVHAWLLAEGWALQSVVLPAKHWRRWGREGDGHPLQWAFVEAKPLGRGNLCRTLV